MIGMGAASKLVFSWGGNPGVGSLHRFRDAVENGWPHALEIEEHSHAGMANRYVAGASNLPFAVLRGYVGTDLPRVTETIAPVICPFTGEELMAVPALNPDVSTTPAQRPAGRGTAGIGGRRGATAPVRGPSTGEGLMAVPALNPDVSIIHAQQADGRGNVAIWGISGIQKEAVLSAKKVIVTVEEVVEEMEPHPFQIVLPSVAIDAIAVEPMGAHPSYADGYHDRDNPSYEARDPAPRDREGDRSWMERHVLG